MTPEQEAKARLLEAVSVAYLTTEFKGSANLRERVAEVMGLFDHHVMGPELRAPSRGRE